MSMQMADSGGGGEPMMDINTTPLIDVMLVLLIMFIITIPIQTHAVKLDLPVNDQSNPPPPDVKPVINLLEIDFLNDIYWNKQKVDMKTLRGYLNSAAKMQPEPELHVKPDALARYEVVDAALAQAQQAGVTKMGFVGNEAYAN